MARCRVTAVWIWVCLAIIVASIAVQFLLGRRIWRAVRELNAEIRALGRVSANLGFELGRIGVAPAVAGALGATPWHEC
jgi:hypothetical protein